LPAQWTPKNFRDHYNCDDIPLVEVNQAILAVLPAGQGIDFAADASAVGGCVLSRM
jgi:hypothetical protein